MTKKFYAVKSGINPGIYRTWEECKEQVIGVSGSKFKSFLKEEEAIEYLKKEDTTVSTNGIIAYVDGSYSSGKIFGCGCVIVKDSCIIEEISQKFEDEELSKLRNVAGEIKAAEIAIKYGLEKGYEKIVICHDYQGVSSWCNGEWKTNKVETKNYKKFYEEAKKSITIDFIKVKAHSSDIYNELADNLAKKAIGL